MQNMTSCDPTGPLLTEQKRTPGPRGNTQWKQVYLLHMKCIFSELSVSTGEFCLVFFKKEGKLGVGLDLEPFLSVNSIGELQTSKA